MSINDELYYYLKEQGYTGSLSDMFYKWKGTLSGNINDAFYAFKKKPKITPEPPLLAGVTRWSMDSRPVDWVLANQRPTDLVDHSSYVSERGAINALKIYTEAGTTQRKKLKSAKRYGAGRFRWRTYISDLDNNDRASIGSWLWLDDLHELDYEVCHGTAVARAAHNAKSDEVLAYCTSQDGPWYQTITPIKKNAWHLFEIDIQLKRVGAAWVYFVTWLIDDKQVGQCTMEFGQSKPFHIFCSIENLNFTGDHLPLKDNYGLWDYVEYIPYEYSIAPVTPA